MKSANESYEGKLKKNDIQYHRIITSNNIKSKDTHYEQNLTPLQSKEFSVEYFYF
jgi:hypothetical protein